MKVLAAVSNGLSSDLETSGLEILPVASLDDLESALSNDPSFAVIDESLPFATDMMVRLKSQFDGPDRDRLPVVAIGQGARILRCLPDATLPAQQGSGAKITEVAKAIIMRRARQRRLFDQEAVLQVPTTPEDVEKAGDLLEQLVAAAGYDEEDQVKLGNTIREAMGNAAEHGNKNDPARTIHINFLRSRDRITIVITDEGPGFDTNSFLTRADQVSALEHTRSRRANEARPGGLGVFIMKQTCDGILFNESGNSIYLMKFLPGQAP